MKLRWLEKCMRSIEDWEDMEDDREPSPQWFDLVWKHHSEKS